MQDGMMNHHWNTSYIVLSVVIAIVTSFFALELARRFRQDAKLTAPIALGALLGYGIWAMHFVGMVAFELPTGVSYDVPRTVISGLLAMLFLVAASMFMFQGQPTVGRILGSGVIAGTGICLMHYLGMAALNVNATYAYSAVPFGLSVLIAVGAASVAFFLFSRVMSANPTGLLLTGLRVGASLVMGLAIAGMHYTGMAAIKYAFNNSFAQVAVGTDPTNIIYMVLGATIIVFVVTYTFILSDQLSAKSSNA